MSSESNSDLTPSPSVSEISGVSNVPVLSKNQLRRKQRYEQWMTHKKQKKLHDKETKIALAIAQGRDLEQERREMEANRLRNEQKYGIEYSSRGLEKFQQKLALAKKSFQVSTCRLQHERFVLYSVFHSTFPHKICLDCSFENSMTDKEIASLSSQIRYCYAVNKKSSMPVFFSVTGLSEHGKTWETLRKVSGFPSQWVPRAFSFSSNCFTEALTSQTSAADIDKPDSLYDKSKFVYLTSDSDMVLDRLDDSKIYIIGGIVDRNRLKGATYKKAQELGIPTAKLPIEQYLQLFSTKVLCCSHVFEILLKYKENGYDWKKAMISVLPARKDAKEVESNCIHGLV
jgi:tRNA (guanine9-N1)-methyltransferase